LAGKPPLDRRALRDLMLRFARLLGDVCELVEAELNSVCALLTGCLVLDVCLRFARPALADRGPAWWRTDAAAAGAVCGQ
jgi:hypothetical protein